MVGKTADKEFIAGLEKMAQSVDIRVMHVDRTIAYYFGTRFNVEMDIVLPKSLSLEEAHDIGVAVQVMLESQEEVERALVHVDIKNRPKSEHQSDNDRVAKLNDMGVYEWPKKAPSSDMNSAHETHNSL